MQIRKIWDLFPLFLALPAALIIATKGFDFSLNEFIDWLLHLYDGYLEDLLSVLKIPEFYAWLQSLLPALPELQPHWKHVFVLLWVFFSRYAQYSSEGEMLRFWVLMAFGGVVAFVFGLAAGTVTYFEPSVFLWPIAGVLFFAAGSWAWGMFSAGSRPSILSLGLLTMLLAASAGLSFLSAGPPIDLRAWAWDLACNFKSPGLTALVLAAIFGAVILLVFGLPGRGLKEGAQSDRFLRNPGRRLGASIIVLFSIVVLVLSVLPWLDGEKNFAEDRRPHPETANIIRECIALEKGAEVCLDMVRIVGTRAFATADADGIREGSVEVRPFWLSRTEVTNAQFDKFVTETNRTNSLTYCSWDVLRNREFADHPVTCITWADATAYAKWLSKKSDRTYRLPSKAEWQYAAVQYDPKQEAIGFELPWGVDDKAGCEYGNFRRFECNNGNGGTAPVGSDRWKNTTSGLADMFGNVWEWTEEPRAEPGVQDYFSAWYRGTCLRAVRGGSWYNHPRYARLAYRDRLTLGDFEVGFRLARTN